MSDNASPATAVDRISGAIDRAVSLLCAACLGAMTIVVILGVFFRYVLNSPLNWAEETSRYLMIWGASVAISLGVSAGEHVGLTVILDGLKSRTARNVLLGIINLFVLGFLLLMFYYSVGTTVEARSQMTQALGISMVLPRLAVPVAMSLSAVQVVLSTIRAFRAPVTKTGGPSYIDI